MVRRDDRHGLSRWICFFKCGTVSIDKTCGQVHGKDDCLSDTFAWHLGKLPWALFQVFRATSRSDTMMSSPAGIITSGQSLQPARPREKPNPQPPTAMAAGYGAGRSPSHNNGKHSEGYHEEWAAKG